MTKLEIIQLLDNNVQKLRKEYNQAMTYHDKEIIRIRLCEAERILNYIMRQEMIEKLNNNGL